MATVTGVTVERADAIEDQIIDSAERSGSSLVLHTKGAGTINVENAFPAPYLSYPVGSIYMTDRPANPSTYMGGGTWSRWGKGRVPVSVDEAQDEFNTVEEMGGAKTHSLTPVEGPTHSHGVTVAPDGVHTHAASSRGAVSGWQHRHGAGGRYIGTNFDGFGPAENEASEHNHIIDVANAGSHSHATTVSPSGSGAPHNNLQPYITVYMWKRTA